MVDLYLKKTKKLLTKRFVWCYYPKRKGKGVFECIISERFFHCYNQVV